MFCRKISSFHSLLESGFSWIPILKWHHFLWALWGCYSLSCTYDFALEKSVIYITDMIVRAICLFLRHSQEPFFVSGFPHWRERLGWISLLWSFSVNVLPVSRTLSFNGPVTFSLFVWQADVGYISGTCLRTTSCPSHSVHSPCVLFCVLAHFSRSVIQPNRSH